MGWFSNKKKEDVKTYTELTIDIVALNKQIQVIDARLGKLEDAHRSLRGRFYKEGPAAEEKPAVSKEEALYASFNEKFF